MDVCLKQKWQLKSSPKQRSTGTDLVQVLGIQITKISKKIAGQDSEAKKFSIIPLCNGKKLSQCFHFLQGIMQNYFFTVETFFCEIF